MSVACELPEEEPEEDACPAGGQHTWRYMTAWERSVDWVDAVSIATFGGSGWYCTECDEEAPPEDDY